MASYPSRVSVQSAALRPIAKAPVAYASAVPRSGPQTVTDNSPVG